MIACNNDGLWNEAGATLDFAILPAYYQTVWFRAICASVFLFLLWMADRPEQSSSSSIVIRKTVSLSKNQLFRRGPLMFNV